MCTCSYLHFTPHSVLYLIPQAATADISKGWDEGCVQYWATDMRKIYKIQTKSMWEMWTCCLRVLAWSYVPRSSICGREFHQSCITLKRTESLFFFWFLFQSTHSLVRFEWQQTLTCCFKSVYIWLCCGPSLSTLTLTGLLGERLIWSHSWRLEEVRWTFRCTHTWEMSNNQQICSSLINLPREMGGVCQKGTQAAVIKRED